MRILITGPSCSGKTTLGRAWAGSRLVELDRRQAAGVSLAQSGDGEGSIFEGIPSGSETEIGRFLDGMDDIVCLQVPFGVRLQRMIERDGPSGLGRFLYNEFAWNRYLLPLLAGNARVRRLSPPQTEGEPTRGRPLPERPQG